MQALSRVPPRPARGRCGNPAAGNPAVSRATRVGARGAGASHPDPAASGAPGPGLGSTAHPRPGQGTGKGPHPPGSAGDSARDGDGIPSGSPSDLCQSPFHSCPCPDFCQELPWLSPCPPTSFASDIGGTKLFLGGEGLETNNVYRPLPSRVPLALSAVPFLPPQNLPRGPRALRTRAELLYSESPILSCASLGGRRPRAPALPRGP